MILGILQARTSSRRLPGKVLKPICGKPMIELQIERLLRAGGLDELMLATSTEASDDPIAEIALKLRLPCFRGNLEDVLERFYFAALTRLPDAVVRFTADCPLTDPELISQIIAFHLEGGYDYSSNTIHPSYPDGLDAEVVSFAALEKAYLEAKLPSEREHVTPYIKNHPQIFNLGSYEAKEDRSELRWTVDEPDDFEFVRAIYQNLYDEKVDFSKEDVYALLESRPALSDINMSEQRDSGLARSVEAEQGQANLEMQERAAKLIPGMTQLLSKRPDQFSRGVWPGYFSKAKGVDVWDLEGRRYCDMSISGIGANVLGYADEDVDGAVKEAISKGTSCSLNCPEEIELAELLNEIHPWAGQTRYTRSGGEAMVVAVRIARAATGRDKIAFCGYHGWHDWYLAANLGTEDALGGHLLSGLSPAGVPKGLAGTAFPFQYNQLEDLEAIVNEHGDDLAAIVSEPLRAVHPTEEFKAGLRDLADRSGAALILDEISSGFRINSGGAHLELGIQPDIAVFSKSIGNGYAIGAILGKSSVMTAAQDSFISSTYWTERIGPTAAIATISKHRKADAGKHLMHIGGLVQKGWSELAHKHGLEVQVGGIAPLSRFSFDNLEPGVAKAYFVQAMMDRGFLASTIFYPMLAHQEANVEQYLSAVDEVFAEMTQGGLDEKLRGEPAVAGFKRIA